MLFYAIGLISVLALILLKMKEKGILHFALWRLLLIPIILFVSLVGVPVLPSQADDGSGFDIVFNPTGTHVHDGYLKVRFDLYPAPHSLTYAKHYVTVPDWPESGYPGRVNVDGQPLNQADYDAWLASLPTITKLNPALSVFVKINPDATRQQVLDYLAQTYNADVSATLDYALVQPDSIHLVSPYMKDKISLNAVRIDTNVISEQAIIDTINSRLEGLELPFVLSDIGIVQPLLPKSITVGSPAIDRGSTPRVITSDTNILFDNPASANGTIDTVNMFWENADGENVKVGMFYASPDPDYTCRDVEAIGTVTFGSAQQFAGLSMTCVEGDFIGMYATAGQISQNTAGFGGNCYANEHDGCVIDDEATYSPRSGDTMSFEGTGEEGGAAINSPTVLSVSSNSIEETTANVTGNITADGGAAIQAKGFDYDIDSGAPYANDVTANTSGTGAFNNGFAGLPPGTKIYWRAKAINTGNLTWGYGSELSLITKPWEVTGAAATPGDGQVQLDWTKGIGSERTEIRRSDAGYPTDNLSGTLVYSGTGNTTLNTGLPNGTTQYYSFFAIAEDGVLNSIADLYATAMGTPSSGVVIPTVTTGAATSVEETTATLNGDVTNTGGENVTARRFQWGTSTGVYTANWSEIGSWGTGAFSHPITGLAEGTPYYFIASVNNSAGWGYGSEQKFLPKPIEPNSLGETSQGTSWIFMEWVKGTGADRTLVRYKTGSYPTGISDGTQAYYNTGTTVNITPLNPNVTYYFRAWSEVTADGMQQYSDNYDQDTAITNIGLPTVTNTGASGVTNTDATLNGDITSDGGDTCNVTWFYGLTDGGATPSWDATANQTGQVAGAINYTISGNLTPSTFYYYTIRVVNLAGTAWSATANFTTSAFAAVGAPTGFTVTDLGGSKLRLDWTKAPTANYTEIRCQRDSYATTNSSGEAIYYGMATTFTITGYDPSWTDWRFTAWGLASDNATISSDYATAKIGGDNMFVMILAIIPLGLTVAMFATRQPMLGFACVIFWAIFGAYCYTESAIAWGDIYYYLFFASALGMTTFTGLAAYGLREKRDTYAEQDMDEGGKGEGRYIDEKRSEEFIVDDGFDVDMVNNGDNKEKERQARRERIRSKREDRMLRRTMPK